MVCYVLGLSLIEYKTLVMRGDMEAANQLLPSIPKARLCSGNSVMLQHLQAAYWRLPIICCLLPC